MHPLGLLTVDPSGWRPISVWLNIYAVSLEVGSYSTDCCSDFVTHISHPYPSASTLTVVVLYIIHG